VVDLAEGPDGVVESFDGPAGFWPAVLGEGDVDAIGDALRPPPRAEQAGPGRTGQSRLVCETSRQSWDHRERELSLARSYSRTDMPDMEFDS